MNELRKAIVIVPVMMVELLVIMALSKVIGVSMPYTQIALVIVSVKVIEVLVNACLSQIVVWMKKTME